MIDIRRKPIWMRNILMRFLWEAYYSNYYRRNGRAVERFCLFVGFGRTGSSLVGALLNAHPAIAIAHERFWMRQIRTNKRGDFYYKHHAPFKAYLRLKRDAALGHLLHYANRTKGAKGFKQFSYDYTINLTHQTASQPVVVGDKAARINANYIIDNGLSGLRTLCAKWSLTPTFISVVRNPYDIITTLCIRHYGDDNAIEDLPTAQLTERMKQDLAPLKLKQFIAETLPLYIDRLATSQEVVSQIQQSSDLPLKFVHYDNFTKVPQAELADLVKFLGLESPPEYLEACAKIVKPVSVTRHLLAEHWTPDMRAQVERITTKYEWLSRYSFDS